MNNKDKKRLFRGIILLVPWIVGASVGPLGLALAALFDIVYLSYED